MKILTLLRHAKSGWNDPVARDFDRPLNRRGRKAAKTIGQEMRNRHLGFDRVIASPAARVVETIKDVVDGYGRPIQPDYDERLYLASLNTLLDVVRETDNKTERLLIVGHNPGLELLAMFLTRDDSNGLRDEVAVKYPTATLAEIHLPIDEWADISEAAGQLETLVRPRDLDPELGPDQEGH